MPNEPPPLAEPFREVSYDTLRTDISLCLQMVDGRVVREAAAREAFSVVAGAIIDTFKARGYRITEPPPAIKHGWPPPSSYLKE